MVVAVCINQLVGADNLRLQASGENPIDVLRGVNPQQVFAGDLPLNRVNMPGGDPGPQLRVGRQPDEGLRSPAVHDRISIPNSKRL